MWMQEPVDLAVQRNTTLPLGFEISDLQNNIIDLTEYNISMRIANGEGETPIAVIAATEFQPSLGKFNIKISGSVFSIVNGNTQEVRLAYNLIATDSDNNTVPMMRGTLILTPGV